MTQGTTSLNFDPVRIHKARAMLDYWARLAREDAGMFFELVIRHETNRTPLRLAEHQKVVLSFLLAHKRAGLIMPIRHGKCVEGDTEIVDPDTGVLRTIREVVQTKHPTVLTWDKERGIHAHPITAHHATGHARCLRITTRTGRSIVTTPEHPFLTPEGWVRADRLQPCASIGVARKLPPPRRSQRISEPALDLLAVLLAEGCTTKSTPMFSTSDPKIVTLVHTAARAMQCEVRHVSRYDYSITGTWCGNRVSAEVVRRYGLQGKKSKEKIIPDEVFGLPDDQLARFLGLFWMCDGGVGKPSTSRTGPFIGLASQRMVRQIQHLLLRFGIQSGVDYKLARYQDKTFDSWLLTVRSDSFESFSNHVLPHMWGEKAKRVRILAKLPRRIQLSLPRISERCVDRITALASGSDVTSLEVMHSMDRTPSRSRTWKELLFSCDSRGGVRAVGGAFKFLGAISDCVEEFSWWDEPSLYWDEVVAIEDAGIREVFDLTVSPTSCFLANDFIAHNTWLAACLTLWLLGRNPSLRGAIVSATQDQAAKVLGMVSDYIINSAELKLVFPHLRPTQRSREPWTQTAITIDRPAGIRDASLKAIGLDGAIAGSRLDWIVIDDVLNQENTLTIEGCRKTIDWLDSSVLTRLEPSPETRVLGLNTPWNPKDAIHELERRGWATMRMSIDGTIKVQDDAEEALAAKEQGRPYEYWDHPGIIPRTDHPNDTTLRLGAHEPGSPLWPEIYTPQIVKTLKRVTPIHEWNRAYMCTAISDEEAMCKLEYIEACKHMARKAHVTGFVTEWPEPSLAINAIDRKQAALAVFTGVDLAVKQGQQHDLTAFFTFAVLPDGKRRILDIESGRFTGPMIVEKIILKHKQFGGVMVVEDVGAQDYIRQFVRSRDFSIPIRPYNTSAIKKANAVYGVATVFTEMANGAWLFPNDEHGRMHHEMNKFIEACLEYTPDDHVADVLMAQFFAREQARKWGLLTPEQKEAQSLASVLMR